MAVNAALAGLVMLIVGDSHIAATSFFNDALQDALVSQGAAVHSFGVCGAAGADWINPAPIVCGRGERHNSEPARIDTQHNLRGWALPDLINKYKPNLVVIELGDTLAGYGVMPTLPRALIDEQVRELLIPIKSRNLPCIWIGPPWGPKAARTRRRMLGSRKSRTTSRRLSRRANTSIRRSFRNLASGRRATGST